MLSKETTDQIRKEAGERFPYFNGEYRRENATAEYERDAYIIAAETWAVWKEKAEGYEKALKEISKLELHDNLLSRDLLYNCIGIATKALESFNQNKVK